MAITDKTGRLVRSLSVSLVIYFMYPEQYIRDLDVKIEKVERALRFTSREDKQLIDIFEHTLLVLQQVKANHRELSRLIQNKEFLN